MPQPNSRPMQRISPRVCHWQLHDERTHREVREVQLVYGTATDWHTQTLYICAACIEAEKTNPDLIGVEVID